MKTMARPMTMTAKRRPLAGGMAIRDESQPTGRFTFAVFVVAELSAPERLLPG